MYDLVCLFGDRYFRVGVAMARFALIGTMLLFAAMSIISIDSPILAAATPGDLKECGDVDNAAAADHNIEVCNRIIADSTETISNQALAYANRCGLLFTKREYDRALPDCDKAIELNPNLAGAFNNRGNNWRGKGEHDRAIADYDRAIELRPSFATAYDNRAASWMGKRDPARAIVDYDRAIELNPKNAAYFRHRGVALQEQNALDRAIADFNQAIALNPKYALAYQDRGRAWRDQGQIDRALADHDYAIKLDPNIAASYRQRGYDRRRKGDLDGAIADFGQAIKLAPSAPRAYYDRGVSRRNRGDLEDSIADFDRAVQLAGGPYSILNYNTFRGPPNQDFPKWQMDGDFTLVTAAYLDRGIAHETAGDIELARADYDQVLLQPPLNDNDRLARDAAQARLTAFSTGIGRRIALVVGNSEYKAVGALPNPQRDANAVALALRRVGFQTVMVADDLGREKFTDTLRRFARESERADWALVYYAGHGIEMGGVNYLIPIDARLEIDRDVEFEAIPLQRVMSSVEGAKRLRLVLLDACRDNPFARKMRRSIASRSVGRGLARVEPNAGTLVVYSAKDGEIALDGEGGANSPFATAFVKNLLTPGLEVRRLFDLVRDDVMEETNNNQQPFAYGSVSGRQDFYFVQK